MSLYAEDIALFKALADEQRLRILEMLRQGEKCACKLLENLEISQSSLSYHMKILTNSGIVSATQSGKWTYYRIDEAGSAAGVDMLRRLTQTEEETTGASCCRIPQGGIL